MLAIFAAMRADVGMIAPTVFGCAIMPRMKRISLSNFDANRLLNPRMAAFPVTDLSHHKDDQKGESKTAAMQS